MRTTQWLIQHDMRFRCMVLCALAADGGGSGQACELHRTRFQYKERIDSVTQRYAAGGSYGGTSCTQEILEHGVFGRVERIGRSDRSGALPAAKVCRVRGRKVIGQS